MSKHWRPDGSAEALARTRWAKDVPRQSPQSRFSVRDISLMLLAGLGGGALFVAVPMLWSAPEPTDESWREAKAPDPWAESRRSREILEAQEGSPGEDPRVPSRRGGTPAAVRIVDGDTFWYGGQKIRIADIDTPEVKGRCDYERQLAARATARMATLLAAGPFELERIGRDTDQYGRKLRVVTRGGRSLGDQLVAEGLARTWSGRREPWC